MNNKMIVGLFLTVYVVTDAHSEPWEYSLSADFGAIYSDNILLAPRGFEDSEIVYTIVPQLSLGTDGDRISADINYRAEAYFYDTRSDADQVFNIVDAALTGVLAKDRFFIDVDAIKYQTIISPDERVPVNTVPISSNREDVTVVKIRPYWQENFGSATLLADVAYGRSYYDSPGALDGIEKSAQIRLDNSLRKEGFSWGIDYRYRRFEYDNLQPWEYQRAGAELGYWMSENSRVFVGGGVETPYDSFFDPDMDDGYWEAGIEYAPNRRIKLEVAGGERGFGRSYRGLASYTWLRGESTLSYSERLATQGQSIFGRRPIVSDDNLDDFLDQTSGSNQFVRKKAEWQTRLELSKMTSTLRLFSESRDESFLLDGTPANDVSNRGAALRINWSAGSRTSFGFSTDVARRETESRTVNHTRFAIGVTYEMSRRLTLLLTAQRAKEDREGTTDDDYRENQFHIILRTKIL